MTQFPDGFEAKYRTILGADADAFFESFETPAVSAFRINPRKQVSQQALAAHEKIPGSADGYYGKVDGHSPEHVTGAVYSQEPAAQQVGDWAGEIITGRHDLRALDLCAAPGGKSTNLLSNLTDDSLLISNEISGKRAKILVENLERWGAGNVVVLNEKPSNLTAVFPQFFDFIVVDAPCSGEGMFRKDSDAMQYWTPDYPSTCQTLQREILTEALQMLAPGGYLLYATCTWAPEEDEAQVAWLQSQNLQLVKSDKLYPHQFRGEGQFMALLQAPGTAHPQATSACKSNLSSDKRKLWQEWALSNLTSFPDGILQAFGDVLYLLPPQTSHLSSLKIARNGLQLGTFKKNRFEPAFALGLATSPDQAQRTYELTDDEFYRVMAGETLASPGDNGWLLLTIHGNGLTFAKRANGIIKNNIPKGLRFTHHG